MGMLLAGGGLVVVGVFLGALIQASATATANKNKTTQPGGRL
jgi:hypothetical protein